MAEEIVLHTLRDCTKSKEAWLHILIPEIRGVFFQQDLRSWLRCNLYSHVSLHGTDISWSVLFASLLCESPKQHHTPMQRIEHQEIWPWPPLGWICLNVDGAVSTNSSMGSTAELLTIYVGLKVAWGNGFEYVQVQSDCLEAVKLLQDLNLVCSTLSLT
ncbi:hypothetical protein V6N11_040435 [Hibiscus sabdariffa]|uniref:RNase H type-1 domain-containing protein n=1 Tax=Hibiscus sabdariffa TaxID=183260 RepID=A0ABR2RHP7_9ROSI